MSMLENNLRLAEGFLCMFSLAFSVRYSSAKAEPRSNEKAIGRRWGRKEDRQVSQQHAKKVVSDSPGLHM